MSQLALYNYFRSSTSYRVRIALHYKNLDFEYKPIHLLNQGGEQNLPEYRKLNPSGGVPSLVHNGKTISQTMAIFLYLDEAFPDSPNLFPKNAYGKAKVAQICEMVNSDIHPLTNLKMTQYLDNKLKLSDQQKKEWTEKWVPDGLAAIEKVLAQTAGNYCYGDSLTAADMFLIPQIFTAVRAELDLKSYPTITRINEKCLALQVFRHSHPNSQIDTPEEFKGNL